MTRGCWCHRTMSTTSAATTATARGRPLPSTRDQNPPAVASKAAATKCAPDCDSVDVTYAAQHRHRPGSDGCDHHLARLVTAGRWHLGHVYMGRVCVLCGLTFEVRRDQRQAA